MSNDLLALSGIGAGLPQEPEYDAVYAAVTATERGRWFLTEYAGRNRQADTDLVIAAIARIEAAMRGDAFGNRRTADIAAAAERISDVAIGLRERAADAALCDALDAAVREIFAACRNDAVIADSERTPAPIEEDAATPSIATPPVVPRQPENDAVRGAEDAFSDALSEPCEFELQDGKKFAEAAAALATSLNLLTDEAETAHQAPSVPSKVVVPVHDFAPAAEPIVIEPERRAPRWVIEAPDFVFHLPNRQTNGHVVETPGQSGRSGSTSPLLPGPRLLPGPQDDPADLFEPAPVRMGTLPYSAAVPSAAAPASPTATIPSPQLRPATGPTVRALPRPVPVDPLVALRALSAEELIALFG